MAEIKNILPTLVPFRLEEEYAGRLEEALQARAAGQATAAQLRALEIDKDGKKVGHLVEIRKTDRGPMAIYEIEDLETRRELLGAIQSYHSIGSATVPRFHLQDTIEVQHTIGEEDP